MLSWMLGIAAFLLFFVYDVNSVTLRAPLLHTGFFLGVLLLLASTGLDLLHAWRKGDLGGGVDGLLFCAALACLAALLYTLFFALPFEATYQAQDLGRLVYDRGVYALCRHPCVLFFFGLYLFLGLAALPSGLLIRGMVFSGLNLLYVVFQDRVTFPRTFCDYGSYRTRVPFLIPTGRSVRQAIRTWDKKAL